MEEGSQLFVPRDGLDVTRGSSRYITRLLTRAKGNDKKTTAHHAADETGLRVPVLAVSKYSRDCPLGKATCSRGSGGGTLRLGFSGGEHITRH